MVCTTQSGQSGQSGAKSNEVPVEQGERGIALLITVFVIAIGTIIVFELGRMARYDQRSARAFAERIQGNYVIRSGFTVAQIILALPKPDQTNVKEDWPGDLWSKIGAARTLPVEGLPGETRMQIVDESSKMNVNLLGNRGTNGNRWKVRFALLFNQLGFEKENFKKGENRTVGDLSLDFESQTAAIADWIDEDSNSLQSPAFAAKGFESDAPPGFFFNRELKNINELLLVPGMTRERVSRAMPYIRVDDSNSEGQRINVNTAKYETLVALGYPETMAAEISMAQGTQPIDQARLTELNKIDPALQQVTTTASSGFSVIVRVRLPNSVRWGRAIMSSGPGVAGSKTTSILSVEIY